MSVSNGVDVALENWIWWLSANGYSLNLHFTAGFSLLLLRSRSCFLLCLNIRVCFLRSRRVVNWCVRAKRGASRAYATLCNVQPTERQSETFYCTTWRENTTLFFLLQKFMFNSVCHLPFLCNYLWNLLAMEKKWVCVNSFSVVLVLRYYYSCINVLNHFLFLYFSKKKWFLSLKKYTFSCQLQFILEHFSLRNC